MIDFSLNAKSSLSKCDKCVMPNHPSKLFFRLISWELSQGSIKKTAKLLVVKTGLRLFVDIGKLKISKIFKPFYKGVKLHTFSQKLE